MKPERDKTTHVSTCIDLQLQEMEDSDAEGLRKMRGRRERRGVQVRAGGFAGRDSKVKNKQTKTVGRRHAWKETKTSSGEARRGGRRERGEKVRYCNMTEKCLFCSPTKLLNPQTLAVSLSL